MNGLNFLWYRHNSVTIYVITQIAKFVGAKARFAGVDLEPSLLEVGEHLFEDRQMFCSRAFFNMQKVISVNMHFV